MELFNKGGILMYPLLLGSILALTFGLERLYHFLRAGNRRELIKEVLDLVTKGKLNEALQLSKKIPGPIAAVATEAINNRDKNKQEMEEAISMKGSIELKRLNQNLHMLELIGRTSPLIGLLGTVLGMVEAFKNLASVKGTVDPSLLAGGIWEALITTVAGLCVAIPALIMHHLFEDRVKSISFSMKHVSSELVRLLKEQQ